MLEIKNLTFGWRDSLLQNVNACFNAGEMVRLHGENGCGKTTLLKIMAGMIPHFSRGQILKGDVWIDQVSLLSNPPKTFYPQIAYLPSNNPEFYLFNNNLKEEIRLVEAMRPDSKISDRFSRICSFFPELQTLFEQPFLEMSPFEIRLSLLVVFFLQKAEYFLMDEILTGFSTEERERWIQFLLHLQQEGCAIILASHESFSKTTTVWEIQNQGLIIH